MAVLSGPRPKYSLSTSSPLGATSSEFVPTAEHPVIVFMPEISKTHMGGTMRLGLRPTIFQDGSEYHAPPTPSTPSPSSSTSSLTSPRFSTSKPPVPSIPVKPYSKTRRLYGGKATIWERHRHRYEVNPKYVVQLESVPNGIRFTSTLR